MELHGTIHGFACYLSKNRKGIAEKFAYESYRLRRPISSSSNKPCGLFFLLLPAEPIVGREIGSVGNGLLNFQHVVLDKERERERERAKDKENGVSPLTRR